MDLSLPQRMLLTDSDARVLAVLVRTTKPLSGREIARLAELRQNAAWRTLRRLAGHGLVEEERAGGRTLLYTLNRNHLAADAVIALTRIRSALIERIQQSLESWGVKPRHAWMFGSAARGGGDVDSDIDILLIRPSGVDEEDLAWQTQVSELVQDIRQWTGNHAGISDIPESEIRRLKQERPPVISAIVEDGVSLYGDSATRVFGRAR